LKKGVIIDVKDNGNNAHHFDLARPGSQADKKIQDAVTNITNNGVKN